MLKNPNFEEGFYRAGADELVLGNGWVPWWDERKPTDVPDATEGGYNRRPEYRPEDAQVYGIRRVRQGRYSQKFFTLYGTHTAGFYQQVQVPKNWKVRFSIWVQVWSSQKDDPNKSEQPGEYRVCVGIDPYGGTDPLSDRVVWGKVLEQYDQWIQPTVETESLAETITVFTKAFPRWRVKHNDSYWDEASLELIEHVMHYRSHYVLFPQGTERAWYEAALPYLLHYRVTNGQSADDAGVVHGDLGHTITVINPGEELLAYLRRKFSADLDVVTAATPAELGTILNRRVETNARFG